MDGQQNIAATLRIRRYLRPTFLIIKARTMKKFFKAIFKTVLAISTMLIMLLIILFLFTMIGLLIFRPGDPSKLGNNATNISRPESEEKEYFSSVAEVSINLLVFLTTSNSPDIMTHPYSKNRFFFFYFSSFLTLALFLILSLITAMIYAEFRGYLKHSMQHSLLRRRIGYKAAFTVLQRETGCERPKNELVMKVLEQGGFTPCLLNKMRKKLDELADADKTVGWEEFLAVLLLIESHDRFELINSIEMKKKEKELQKQNSRIPSSLSIKDPNNLTKKKRKWKLLFSVRLPPPIQKLFSLAINNFHGIIQTISSFAVIVNVVVLAAVLEVDFDKIVFNTKFSIESWSFIFTFWYAFEFCFKLVYIIVQRTKNREMFSQRNKYCLISLKLMDMTFLFAIIALTLVLYIFDFWLGYWHHRHVQYFTMIQVICILILLRLLHIITFFPVASTLLRTSIDIARIMLPLFGLIIVIFYEFALLGMGVFGTNFKLDNDTTPRVQQCDTYENLHYFSYNFHDFAAAIVLLWNLMIVNNWHIFLKAFSFATGTNWSWLYFVAWWLISVVITLNVFLTLVIEVCVNHWENFHKELKKRQTGRHYLWRLLLPTGDLEPCSSVIHGKKIYDIIRDELEEPSEEKLTNEVNQHRGIVKKIK